MDLGFGDWDLGFGSRGRGYYWSKVGWLKVDDQCRCETGMKFLS